MANISSSKPDEVAREETFLFMLDGDVDIEFHHAPMVTRLVAARSVCSLLRLMTSATVIAELLWAHLRVHSGDRIIAGPEDVGRR